MPNDMELSREDKINLLVKQHLTIESQKRKLDISSDEWLEAVNEELQNKRKRGKANEI